VLIEGLREDKDVVKIHKAEIISETRHDKLHYSSKLARCISKNETQDLKSPLPLACDKSSLVAVALVDFSLPLPPTEVAFSVSRQVSIFRSGNLSSLR